MKKYIMSIAILLLAVSCSEKEMELQSESEKTEQAPAALSKKESPIIPGYSIVKFDEDLTRQIEQDLQGTELVTRSQEMNSLIKGLGITSMERLYPYDKEFEERTRREGLHRWYIVKYDKNTPYTRAEEDFSSIPGVEIVEPKYRIRTDRFNDPDLKKQWHFYNDGSDGGVAGVDINVEPVWKNYTTGSPKVIVAVIDEGVQLNHEDLSGNCIPAGPDGSKNFFINGYKIDPGDHGSHVAGVISAVNNNGIGISGIAGGDLANHKKGVRILSCEILADEDQYAAQPDPGPAFKWAADKGAVIAQNSWGYPADQNNDGHVDAEELESIKNFDTPWSVRDGVDYFIKYAGCDNQGNQLPDSPMKGGVVFFAAGNDAIQYGVPASYEPVIAVGAIASDGKRSSFSNYGDWVDIAAPGSKVYSAVSGNGYRYMSGTSMACPHVSGVAALVLSYRGGQGFTNDKLKECLIQGANKNKVSSSANIGPLVDALGAVTFDTKDNPANPDFTVKAKSNSVDFEWNLTGTKKGIAAYSHIMLAAEDKALLENVELNNLPEGVISCDAIVGKDCEVGDKQTERLRGLKFNTDYYVALIALSYGRSYNSDYKIRQVRTQKNNPPAIQIENTEDNIVLRSFERRDIKFCTADPDDHKVTVKYDELEGWVEVKPLDDKGNYLLSIDANTFNPGKYTLKFHLTDEYGLKADDSIDFEVLPNRAPEKKKDIEGIICNKPGEKYEFVLSDYVVDPDEEKLEVSYDVSDKGVLHVNLSEGKLYVTILSFGLSEVTLTAKDAKGLSVSFSFKVLVRKDDVFMELYPVPMKKVLNVRTGQNLEKTDIEIISSNGSVVYRGSGDCSAFEPMQIAVDNLAPGRYKVKVTYGGKSESRTVVKK